MAIFPADFGEIDPVQERGPDGERNALIERLTLFDMITYCRHHTNF